jgi:hypothetical protein
MLDEWTGIVRDGGHVVVHCEEVELQSFHHLLLAATHPALAGRRVLAPLARIR